MFKEHWMALMLALVVGGFSLAPSFLATQALGSHYAGLPFMYNDDEDIYLSRIQEVLDGHGMLSSPYFYEYKEDSPLLIFPVGEWLYALPSMAFGISPADTIMAGKLILPALLFVLVYVVSYQLANSGSEKKRRYHGIAVALFVTFGYDFVDVRYVWSVLTGQHEDISLLVWSRSVNPVTGAIFFFSLILVLWKMVQGKSRLGYIPGGILVGLMTGYFFSWGISLAVIGACVVGSLAQKQFRIARDLCFVGLIGVAVAAPYWYNVVTFSITNDGQRLSLRNGLFLGHAPMVNKLIFAATIFFALVSVWYWVCEKHARNFVQSPWWVFCTCLLGASWIVFNQQLVTGRTVWPHHFVQYTIPLVIIVVFTLLYHVVSPRVPRLWAVFLACVSIASLSWAIVAARTYTHRLDAFANKQRYQPLLAWIQTNAPKECVILASEFDNEELNRLLPAFTGCNLYTTPWTFAGVPPERIYHNYLVLLRLRGIDPSDVLDYIAGHTDEIRFYFYEDWNQLFGTVTQEWLTQYRDSIAEDYYTFSQKDFEEELHRYRLDFVIRTTTSSANLYDAYFNHPAYSDGQFTIYDVRP